MTDPRERCIVRRPWWAFWRKEPHAWERLDGLRLRDWQHCPLCGLRRTRVYAFPETWYYDATFRKPAP